MLVAALEQQREIVGDGADHGLDLRLLLGVEIVQHIVLHQVLDAGMPDADAHAPEIGPDMGVDRADAVVPRRAAALLHPHLAELEVDLVIEHGEVVRLGLVELHGGLHRAAAVVHVGLRPQDQRLVAGQRAFRSQAVELLAGRRKAMAASDRARRHEADIVAMS